MIFTNSRDFLLDHVAAMRARVAVPLAADRENLEGLESELTALAKRHKTLSATRVVVFILLYASLASNFALPALTVIVETFTLIASLVGAGILSLAALYLSWRLGQLWNRMTVIGANVIAIYEKHSGAIYPAQEPKTKRVARKKR